MVPQMLDDTQFDHLVKLPIEEILALFPDVPNKKPREITSPTLTSPECKTFNDDEQDFDSEMVELLSRGCRGMLAAQETEALFDFLLSINAASCRSYQLFVHSLIRDRKGGAMMGGKRSMLSKFGMKKEAIVVDVSSYHINFSKEGREVPLYTDFADSFALNYISKSKNGVKFKIVLPENLKSKSFNFEVSPMEGLLKPKTNTYIRVAVRAHSTTHLKSVITVDIEGGLRYFVTVVFDSEAAVFGVDPHTLPQVTDNNYLVPEVLSSLRHVLLDCGEWMLSKGLFQIPGAEDKVLALKNLLNRNQFSRKLVTDPHSITTLIKHWYRDLPVPLLSEIPSNVFLSDSVSTPEGCVSVINMLSHENRNLLSWLVDLLVDVAALKSDNGMSCKKLAIVVAPNLFTAEVDSTIDPVSAMNLPRKVISFFETLLAHKLLQKYGSDA
eukprot:GCRY01005124.1.p1 GENE.GCRY01005124.1~~GCRY01005124.1.p1  ORF type:complete len:440 (+),score=109.41 GCRY01005124.1:191-1510(+)